MSLKRVCIYGAGAIGGWLGVALAKAGCELSAVARGQTLAALQHNGLTLVRMARSVRPWPSMRSRTRPLWACRMLW